MTSHNIGFFDIPEESDSHDTEVLGPPLSASVGERRIQRHALRTTGPGQRGRLAHAAGRGWRSVRSTVAPWVGQVVDPEVPAKRRLTVFAAIVLPVALLGVACASYDPAPTTARVTRASVSAKVTGTGALRSITEQNLGFDKAGKLMELDVAVGQQVIAGQVLARIDDFGAQVGLRKANAGLAREQAALDRIQEMEKVDATSDDAKGAEDIQNATKDQAEEIDRANEEFIRQAQRQLALAQVNLRRAQAAYDADSTRCGKSVGGDSRRKPGEVHQSGGLKGELFVPSPVESSACERARRSGAVVSSAQYRVSDAQTDVERARQRRSVEHARLRVEIERAKREARAAHHQAEDAKHARPSDLAEQAAAVADAQADVDEASRAVANTVLRAPVAGKVAAINGTVGEFISSGSPTTPLAPGGRVALPDVTSGTGSTNDSGSKAERPGGDSFMVLDDVNTFQVIVPFEEADAARVAPNQQVDVSFDSVPGLVKKGTVASVSPTGTSIKDVTNYYVTIVLNELDPRLKDGQTAQASVIIGQVPNVLVVPSSAVQQGGRSGVVTVLSADGQQRQVQVQLGMVGDGVTQVISGLHEGQDVLLASS